MPEASEEVEVVIYLTKEELIKILQMKKGETLTVECGTITFTECDGYEITSTQEVTVEFEMSDYAPERNEGYD